jgi:nitrogenase molybdenum-iron protein alpha/beta subunit
MTCNRNSGEAAVIRPDGFTGALLALEGIGDAAVILHGPTGCRGYHAAISEQWFPRDAGYEPLNYAERFYFGQPRIPTTYLDGDDFVFGGGEKLEPAVEAALKRKPGLLAVVNSPGAALIGDDLKRALVAAAPGTPTVAVEMPGISRPMGEGYQQALIAVLEALQLRARPAARPSVALVGLSIAHQHWEGSAAELRRLLALCGIDVCCVLGAGSPVTEWRRIADASCVAVIHEEYGGRVAQWLARHLSLPVVQPDCGAPVGFGVTEEWLGAVAAATGADPAPALAELRAQRRDVARRIYRIDTFQDILRGSRFSIQADPSFALPLTRWLYEYLGLVPVSIETPDYAGAPAALRLRDFLHAIGCGDAWQRNWREVESEFLFADGNQAAVARISGQIPTCVEWMLASDTYWDVVPKAMLGVRGAAYLVEQVINGIPEP